MTVQKWAVAGKCLGVSTVLTFVFFGIAKLLVGPIAGSNAETYRQKYNLEPPVGDWFIENANRSADSFILYWTFIFCVYWSILSLFGRSPKIVTKQSLIAIFIAFFTNYYFVLDEIFDGYYWSCFEEPRTHSGFDVRHLLECPTRETVYYGLVFASPVLMAVAAIIGIRHSKRKVDIP